MALFCETQRPTWGRLSDLQGGGKVEKRKPSWHRAELADMSHVTSGAGGPEGGGVSDPPAAPPRWPGLSHIPAHE